MPRITAPILLHYAELDERINEGWPAYEGALQEHGKTYEAHIYPGVNHGFHNDSTPRYDQEAAELAWSRTLDWFRDTWPDGAWPQRAARSWAGARPSMRWPLSLA